MSLTHRFLNADAFASTGQGLLGNNMFAYCGNNPVNYEDPSGNLYRSFHWQIDYLFFEGFGGIRTSCSIPSISFDFAIYENTEECAGGEATARIGAASLSTLSVSGEGVSLGNLDFSLVECTLKWNCVEVDIGNMLNGNLSAGISWTGKGSLNAMVSGWSPSITFVTDIGRITGTFDIGAVGIGLLLGEEGAYGFNFAPAGFGVGICWEP